MKLKLRRSQKSTAFRGTAVFQLNAVAELSGEERNLISKYSLGSATVYASEQFQNNAAIAQSGGGVLRSLRAFAAASLNLRITVNDLTQGKQVECKSLEEMMSVEEAITTACQNLKSYLETALTFDGRVVVIEI
jgi:hypothetical protein